MLIVFLGLTNLVFTKKTFQSERGLTMVEMLIAVSLAGILSAGIYSFYFAAAQSWERSTVFKESQQNARLALRAVEQDLRYADWVWIGDKWEENWRDESYPEPGEGEVLYFVFYGDKRAGESRPHLIFNKIWLGPEKTLYLRRKVLLKELNLVYYVNTTPYYLADNILEMNFSYGDEGKDILEVFVKAGDSVENSVELKSTVLLQNTRY